MRVRFVLFHFEPWQVNLILVLWNFQVHIHTSDHSNITSYIKASVNKIFSITTALNISNVQLNYCHIRFWRYFDNIES